MRCTFYILKYKLCHPQKDISLGEHFDLSTRISVDELEFIHRLVSSLKTQFYFGSTDACLLSCRDSLSIVNLTTASGADVSLFIAVGAETPGSTPNLLTSLRSPLSHLCGSLTLHALTGQSITDSYMTASYLTVTGCSV